MLRVKFVSVKLEVVTAGTGSSVGATRVGLYFISVSFCSAFRVSLTVKVVRLVTLIVVSELLAVIFSLNLGKIVVVCEKLTVRACVKLNKTKYYLVTSSPQMLTINRINIDNCRCNLILIRNFFPMLLQVSPRNKTN